MKVGDVVVSVQGHDMGEWYIVSDVIGEFAYLIDGKLKPISKPKKKKIKHKKLCFFVCYEIGRILARN